MVNEDKVKESLKGVLVPAVKRSIVDLNMVREVAISDKKVTVTLASTGLITGAQDWIKEKVIKATGTLPEVDEEVASITEAFVEARYSRQDVDDSQAGRVKRYWERIRGALRSFRK